MRHTGWPVLRRVLAPCLACAMSFWGGARAQPVMWGEASRIGVPAVVETRPAPAPDTPSVLTASRDGANRMTVPVMIDGKGPFAFVIDTGADRTVISRELAATLALPPGQPAKVHATSGAEMEQTAVVDTLQVGRRTIRNVEAPVLSASDLGAVGMLGIDSLRGQSMVMDFKMRRLSVETSRADAIDPHAIIVRAKSRYGELILVDAHIGRTPIYVILDSGAQNTIANSVLRRMLATLRPDQPADLNVDILSVTGGATAGQFRVLPVATLGGMTLHNLPVAFADLHTFAQFDLADRPAMLLGMDVLRIFERVSVDFKHREVAFQTRSEG